MVRARDVTTLMSDTQARLILLLCIAIIMPIGGYHRHRSHTGERLDRRQEGWLILLTLLPMALAFMIGLIAFVVKPSSMAWASMHLPAWARWSGVVIGGLCAIFVTWTYRTLG